MNPKDIEPTGYLYPVNLDLRGRPCLVVGGGRIATKKVEKLLFYKASITVIAPEIAPKISNLVGITIHRRAYEPGDIANYWLAIVATGNKAINKAVFEDGKKYKVWVNSSDDPKSCSLTLPAVLQRGVVSIAVSTSMYSPALARWLKQEVSNLVGPEYDTLALLLSKARSELKANNVACDFTDWKSLIDSKLPQLIKESRIEKAEQLIKEWVVSQLGKSTG
ncbi:MAG: bifunctional precorrin-2 dehydrogenase/sirohydrochlorin ferrochelatase [Actinobacteria bacterium]|nr:bifunctional precorrin-2 dehydrogenase/sirohydrochlorin ferrochelatase [Actinomycetota bacterium]MCL6105097.1 bifunctional precorrin-2 dehydrogenase/sirohydrochlorin ferrochelatase [Actinomycetota bacterium]